MAKDVEYMSKNAYASYLGVNEKSIRKAVAEGKIKKGYDVEKQKIIKHLADKEYGHLHAIAKPRPGINNDKLAVRINEAVKQEKNAANSDKSEQISLKNTSPKKPSRKSEENIEDSSDEDTDDLEEFTYEQLMGRIKITPSMSYSEAYRRTTILNLATEKMKAEELQGILVRRHDVDITLHEFGTQLKKALMSMPLRICDEVLNAGDTVSVVNIITKELTDILSYYANFEKVNLLKD